jgi:hypothetical protein
LCSKWKTDSTYAKTQDYIFSHGTVYFLADFCPVRGKKKSSYLKKPIDILNSKAHGVTNIIFKNKYLKKNVAKVEANF